MTTQSYLFFQFTNSDIKYFKRNFKDIKIHYEGFNSTDELMNNIHATINEVTYYLNKGNDFSSKEKTEFLTSFSKLLLLRNEFAPYVVYLSIDEINQIYRENNYISVDDKQFYSITNNREFTGNQNNTVFIKKILKLRSNHTFIPTYTYGEYDNDIFNESNSFTDYLKAIHLTTLQNINNFDDLVDYSSLCQASSKNKYMKYYSLYNYANDNYIAHLNTDKKTNKELYYNKALFIQLVNTLNKQIHENKTNNKYTKNRIDDRNYNGYLVFMNYDCNHIHLSSYEVYDTFYTIINAIYNVTRGKLPQSLYKQDLYSAVNGKDEDINFIKKVDDANEKMAFRYGSDLKLSFILKNWSDISLPIPIKLNDDLSNYTYSVYAHIHSEIKNNTFKTKEDYNDELTDMMMNKTTDINSGEDDILSNKFNKYIKEVVFEKATQTNTVKNFDKNIFIGFSKSNYSYHEYGALTSRKEDIIKEIKVSYINHVITSFYEELIHDRILENNNTDIIMAQLARLNYLFYLYDESNKDNEGKFNFDDFKSDTRNQIKYYREQSLNRNFCWYYSTLDNQSNRMDLKTFQDVSSDMTINDYYHLLKDYFTNIINHVQSVKRPTGDDYLGISRLDVKTGLSELVEHQSLYYDINVFYRLVTTLMVDIYYKEG
ncbi:MAG: hypothetical protein LUG60_12590 [Erysipelotrichaceae bacterium]|nr:hypothetical protein [Erysipelotrichaceae bacterium]